MDELLGRALDLTVVFVAAALAAVGLGILHVPVSFTARWASCVLIASGGRLVAFTTGSRS